MRVLVLGLLAAASLPTGMAAADSALPVVVAIDASRSLRPAELAAAREQLSALLGQLPPDTPSGLLAFADDAKWVQPLGTPLGAIPAALATVELSGRHTLLHDALFTVADALEPSGGVIVLVTDGLDENSATTVEDVSRRCELAGVRVVTVGLGRVRERELRRISLLTRGAFLGPLPQIQATALADAVEAAAAERAALEQEREQRRAENVPPAVAAQPAAAAAQPPPAPASTSTPAFPWWGWVVLALGLVAGILALVLVLRGRGAPAADPRALALEAELRSAEERELQLALRDRPVSTPDETAEIAIPRDLRDEVGSHDEDDPFEKTRVLAQRSLLMVKEPGAAIRSMVLRGERAFGVGRDAAGNTLRIIDAAMSGRHFKLVPDDDTFVLVDLGSTNGTYVNRERVRARRLGSGDVIHAGQVEFEFRTFDQPLN